MTALTVLNWNIGNPSADRAITQLNALANVPADIICLTETKDSKGSQLVANGLANRFGYKVHFPKPAGGEYGALLASKHPMTDLGTYGPPGQEARAPRAHIPHLNLDVLGLYVPSNNLEEGKRQRKKAFLDAVIPRLTEAAARRALLLADLNSVASNHPTPAPHLPFEERKWVDDLFAKWSDCMATDAGPTWFSWRGESYRYDYCFTAGLQVIEGQRLERLRGPGLSDHVGLLCRVGTALPNLTVPAGGT